MALTDSLTVWCDWIFNRLQDPTFMANNGITTVVYGDRERITDTPLVCVEPSGKSRAFNGAPRRTQIDFEAFILVYHGTLSSVEQSRKEVDALAETIERRLHEDPTCGSLVIHSVVSRLESGVANKGGNTFRTTRITFTAVSQIHLPMAPGA